MTDPTPNCPLWEVMHDAYLKPNLSGPRGHLGFAAEIRAIADWLEAMWTAQGPPASIPMEFVEGLAIGMAIHREGTLNILRAEADRAEAGEPEPTFTPEEVELHQAPWSYLSPPEAD